MEATYLYKLSEALQKNPAYTCSKRIHLTWVSFPTIVSASSIAWTKVATLYVKNPTSIGINSKCMNPNSGTTILHPNTELQPTSKFIINSESTLKTGQACESVFLILNFGWVIGFLSICSEGILISNGNKIILFCLPNYIKASKAKK